MTKYAISIYGNESTLIKEFDSQKELQSFIQDQIAFGKKIEFIMEYESFKSLIKGPSI